VKCAIEDLADYRLTLSQSSPNAQQSSIPSPTQWSRPPVNIIKLNWDSALDRNKKLIGVGVIAQDWEGNVMALMCSIQQYISDPSVAEAYGARQAVEFGCFLGLNSVIVEGDATVIISALGRTEEEDGNFGSLIMDARSLLCGFLSWDISHVRRDGNMVSHVLAKFAISFEQTKVWFESYPTCLSGLVNSERLSTVS